MEKIKNILLVVNPISGAIDKSDLKKLIKEEVEKIDANFFIFPTTGEEDKFNLQKKIKEIDPERIIVAGGDGTITLTTEALEGEKIPVGIIPAGSANGLAANLHLPDSIEDQIEVALGNNFIDYDIVLINGEYCLHMSDFGLNAELVNNYEKSNLRGKMGYVLQSIPTLIKSDYPFKFQIEANNEVYKREAPLLVIANANAYGTGAKVNPKGKPNDGKFEILVFKKIDLGEILKTLRNEDHLDPDFIEVISTSEAKIFCEKPIAFQIDGEYLGKRKFAEVKILPQKLRIVIP